MTHRREVAIAVLLPVALTWACGGPSKPPANPPKIEAVRPTVEKAPPAPSSKPR